MMEKERKVCHRSGGMLRFPGCFHVKRERERERESSVPLICGFGAPLDALRNVLYSFNTSDLRTKRFKSRFDIL
jgi:hypothetical protein